MVLGKRGGDGDMVLGYVLVGGREVWRQRIENGRGRNRMIYNWREGERERDERNHRRGRIVVLHLAACRESQSRHTGRNQNLFVHRIRFEQKAQSPGPRPSRRSGTRPGSAGADPGRTCGAAALCTTKKSARTCWKSRARERGLQESGPQDPRRGKAAGGRGRR